jgi:hypothetical protein
MFYVDGWALEFIICLLDVLENDFGEVDESLFQSVERHIEIILCFLGIEKSDFEEFA